MCVCVCGSIDRSIFSRLNETQRTDSQWLSRVSGGVVALVLDVVPGDFEEITIIDDEQTTGTSRRSSSNPNNSGPTEGCHSWVWPTGHKEEVVFQSMKTPERLAM